MSAMKNAEGRMTKRSRGAGCGRLWLWCFIILYSSFCLQSRGQSYSIDWYKVAGGGGTSTGGVYSVSGTVGQPDSGGPMTGGNYSVTGGFWSLISVVAHPRRAAACHQPCRQHGDGLLAERVGLELAAEQQCGRALGLVGQQRGDDRQRHELPEPHLANGQFVLPSEQSLS